MSSSRLRKTRRDSCRRLSASCWRRGMKCCSVLGSSELPSVSLSKLSTRQFPRLHISLLMSAFATCGSTTAKGLFANSFFVLIHYAFGGVRAQALLCLCSPLRPRGRAAVFRRREGPASQSFSRGSPSLCSCSLSSVRGFFSSRGWPPSDPFGIRPPFVIKYVFVVVLSYTRGGRQPGRPDVSSRPRLCTSLRPRFPKSTVTAGTWTWTPSYVARLVVYGVVHGCRTFPGVKCLRG